MDPVLGTSGSRTDRPATTAVYKMKVYHKKDDGFYEFVDAQKTVKVRPGTKKFLIVGDTSTADVGSVRAMLPIATTVVADVVRNLPTDATGYDAIILTDGADMRKADAPRIQPWLDANKGVIVVGRAAKLLATGDLNNRDVSSVAGWFGGCTQCGNEINYSHDLVKGIAAIPYSSTYQIKDLYLNPLVYETNPGGGSLTLVGSGSRSGAWVFELPGAGRVFYIGTTVACDPTNAVQTSDVFIAGARWAAGG